MREITFVCPTSKLTRTIKVCETQKELVRVVRKCRILENGSVFVIYKNDDYFHQLFGSYGCKTGHFKRYGIKSATVSLLSGEFFVFGDFAITPEGSVCIGEDTIKKYGSYSGQYDVKLEKTETKTETKAKTKTETKAKTKAKTTINMEHFEDDMDYFMEHFEDEWGYELIIWD